MIRTTRTHLSIIPTSRFFKGFKPKVNALPNRDISDFFEIIPISMKNLAPYAQEDELSRKSEEIDWSGYKSDPKSGMCYKYHNVTERPEIQRKLFIGFFERIGLGFCALYLCSVALIYYYEQESKQDDAKKMPEEEGVEVRHLPLRQGGWPEVTNPPNSPPNMRQIDLGPFNPDLLVGDVLGDKPRFEVWDMTGYEYNEKMGMWWKPLSSEQNEEIDIDEHLQVTVIKFPEAKMPEVLYGPITEQEAMAKTERAAMMKKINLRGFKVDSEGYWSKPGGLFDFEEESPKP